MKTCNLNLTIISLYKTFFGWIHPIDWYKNIDTDALRFVSIIVIIICPFILAGVTDYYNIFAKGSVERLLLIASPCWLPWLLAAAYHILRGLYSRYVRIYYKEKQLRTVE